MWNWLKPAMPHVHHEETSATVWLIDAFLNIFGQWWNSMAQRWKIYSALARQTTLQKLSSHSLFVWTCTYLHFKSMAIEMCCSFHCWQMLALWCKDNLSFECVQYLFSYHRKKDNNAPPHTHTHTFTVSLSTWMMVSHVGHCKRMCVVLYVCLCVCLCKSRHRETCHKWFIKSYFSCRWPATCGVHRQLTRQDIIDALRIALSRVVLSVLLKLKNTHTHKTFP